MQWTVPGLNAKILAQAFQCLAKMGEEVYIEGTQEALIFRTVNQAKTAYAAFKFAPHFFTYYPNVTSGTAGCQVSVKSLLIAFRFPAHIEKLVESCGFILQPAGHSDEETIQLHFRYKPGLIKKVKLQLLDEEIIRETYNPDAFPSRFSLLPRMLAELLTSFHCPELTLVVTKSSLHFRNFSEACDDELKLRTDMLVPKEDLLSFQIANDTEITFTLSELRTVLSFAEQLNVPITIHFEKSGKPVCFVLKNDLLILEMVLATIESGTSQHEPQQYSQCSSFDMSMNEDRTVKEDSNELSQLPPCSQPGLLRNILVRKETDMKILGDILAPDSDPDSDPD